MEMTRALLYKKTDRWQIWVSLLATVTLFGGAVALVRAVPFVPRLFPDTKAVETGSASPRNTAVTNFRRAASKRDAVSTSMRQSPSP